MTSGRAVLGLDASGEGFSVALWGGGRLLAERRGTAARGQGEALLPAVEAAAAEAGLGLGELAALAAVRGPGSFTGLRITLAAAEGLSLGLGLPLAGFTAFEAALAALDPPPPAPLLVAVDARRAELFLWRAGAPAAEIAALAPAAAVAADQGPPPWLTGNGAEALAAAYRQAGREIAGLCRPGLSTAAAIARATAELSAAEIAARPATPLYLRGADVTLPKGGR